MQLFNIGLIKWLSLKKKNMFFFKSDQSGATAVEYAILAAAVALVVLILIFGLGDQVEEMFSAVSERFNS